MQQSYIREDETRLKAWQAQKSSGKDVSSKQFEVFKKKISEACPKPTEYMLKLKEAQPKRYNRRIITFDNGVDKMVKDAEQDPHSSRDMKPVPVPVKSTLYEGFSKEGKGRSQYLSIREQHIPEEKYHYPLLSSWDYGWRLNDVVQRDEIGKPENGRTRIVSDTFYTRNGVPDLQATSSTF